MFGVFDRDGFEKSSPKFSFSVKDDCVSINAYGEKGSDGYELYKCGTKRGDYALELTASRPIFDCRVLSESVSGKTSYLIVGEAPGAKKLSTALANGVKIITESQFTKMLLE